LEVLTPADRRLHGGITSFRLKGRTSAADNVARAKQLLDQFGIFTVQRTGVAAGACVRITPALFTSEDHINQLVRALEAIAAA
jgi:isopenicillin-N epimerase